MRLVPTSILAGSLIDFSPSDDYITPNNATSTSPATSPWTGIQPGSVVEVAATDPIDLGTNVPNWVGGEVMAVLNTSASTFGVGRLVHVDKNAAILDVPATAGTGRPVYVCITAFSAGNVTPQFGWVMRSGICPVQFSAAATVGPVGRGSAGQATPTLAAGAQILNATTLIAAASAFTRTGTTRNGSNVVIMGRTNGIFPGITVSGTGLSGTVTAVPSDGATIVLSANATATGTVTVTFTPTGFGIVQIERPFHQGQIL